MKSTYKLKNLDLWQQRPDESDKAYHCFRIYVELGSERSLNAVRRKAGRRPSYKRQLERWSSKYNWVDRTKEYDERMAVKLLDDQKILQNKAKEKVLNGLNGLIDKLFEIAKSNDGDRVKAIELLLNQAKIK